MTNNQNSEQDIKELAITQWSLLAWSATFKCIISLLAKVSGPASDSQCQNKGRMAKRWQNEDEVKYLFIQIFICKDFYMSKKDFLKKICVHVCVHTSMSMSVYVYYVCAGLTGVCELPHTYREQKVDHSQEQ